MADDEPVAWIAEKGGVVLWLRLTPKGGRDAIDGLETLSDGRRVLKARVRAAAQDGLANEAAIELVARAVDLRASAVDIIAGQTGRLKKLFLAGDPAQIIAALRPWAAPASKKKDHG